MQAKTRGLTHTPPNPPTLGDFVSRRPCEALAFVVWSKLRVLLPPKLGGWGGHLRANLNFSKSAHHEHLHAENDRARLFPAQQLWQNSQMTFSQFLSLQIRILNIQNAPCNLFSQVDVRS
jgi:hypothetical protein